MLQSEDAPPLRKAAPALVLIFKILHEPGVAVQSLHLQEDFSRTLLHPVVSVRHRFLRLSDLGSGSSTAGSVWEHHGGRHNPARTASAAGMEEYCMEVSLVGTNYAVNDGESISILFIE